MELQTREMAHIQVEDPLLAVPDGLDISSAIENREGIVVEQRQGTVVREGRLRANIELLADCDDIGRSLFLRELGQ